MEEGILQKMVDQYEYDLDHFYKVLIVSHSQGNFYASEALERIAHDHYGEYPATRIGMGNVRVASPASDYFHAPLITFDDDWVINAARIAFSAPRATLPAIGSGPSPTRDPWGHQFVKAYMNTPESRKLIEDSILSVASEIKVPRINRTGVRYNLKHSSKYLVELKGLYPDGMVKSGIDESCVDLEEGRYQPRFSFYSFDATEPVSFELELELDGIKRIYPFTAVRKIVRGESIVALKGTIPEVNLIKTANGFEETITEVQRDD